jgi:hypothetical protein
MISFNEKEIYLFPFFKGGWMSVPQGIPNCPPGLEYLTTIDQLLVKQKVELLEVSKYLLVLV